jgi:hypothetical protein
MAEKGITAAPSAHQSEGTEPVVALRNVRLWLRVDHYTAELRGPDGYLARYDLPPGMTDRAEVKRRVTEWATGWIAAWTAPKPTVAIPDALPAIRPERYHQDFYPEDLCNYVRDPRTGAEVYFEDYAARYPADPRVLDKDHREWVQQWLWDKRYPRCAQLRRQAEEITGRFSAVAYRAAYDSREDGVIQGDEELVHKIWPQLREGGGKYEVTLREDLLYAVGFVHLQKPELEQRARDEGENTEARVLELLADPSQWVLSVFSGRHPAHARDLAPHHEKIRAALSAWGRKGGPLPGGQKTKDRVFAELLVAAGLLRAPSDNDWRKAEQSAKEAAEVARERVAPR